MFLIDHERSFPREALSDTLGRRSLYENIKELPLSSYKEAIDVNPFISRDLKTRNNFIAVSEYDNDSCDTLSHMYAYLVSGDLVRIVSKHTTHINIIRR